MKKRTFYSGLIRHLRRIKTAMGKNIYQLILMREKDKQVIVVVGVQRSGTNMVMGVLDRNYETEVFHERDPRAYINYEMRDYATIHNLIDNSRANFVVIKSLCELQDLNIIMKEFGSAKVIWVYRECLPVVNSHVERWTSMPWSIAKIVEDRDGEAGWRGRGMSDETYNQVRELYYKGMNNESACALFWYFRSKLFFELGLDQCGAVMVVKYDDLLEDPVGQGRRICEFSGLGYSPRMTNIVSKNIGTKMQDLEIDPEIMDVCSDLENRFRLYLDKTIQESA